MSVATGGRAYCRGRLKRAFDLIAAASSLALLSPLLGAIAILIRLTSGPPVLFRQERVGMDGRSFRIVKFRTMRPDLGGLPITGHDDDRITGVGRLLRRTKLDELPQFLNVLRGEMSVVGPRPEIPRYVTRYSPEERRVLEVRPGLTDEATLRFRDEEGLLGQVPPDAREEYYVKRILPSKLALNLRSIERAGFLYDLSIIIKTLGAIVAGERR